MTCGDFLRLDNQLLPIKEIEKVVQDHGYGLDHITIRLDGKSGDIIRRYFAIKVDGSWSNGFEVAVQSLIDELERHHKTLTLENFKEEIITRSIINQLKEIKTSEYDYAAAERKRIEELHRLPYYPTCTF